MISYSHSFTKKNHGKSNILFPRLPYINYKVVSMNLTNFTTEYILSCDAYVILLSLLPPLLWHNLSQVRYFSMPMQSVYTILIWCRQMHDDASGLLTDTVRQSGQNGRTLFARKVRHDLTIQASPAKSAVDGRLWWICPSKVGYRVTIWRTFLQASKSSICLEAQQYCYTLNTPLSRYDLMKDTRMYKLHRHVHGPNRVVLFIRRHN